MHLDTADSTSGKAGTEIDCRTVKYFGSSNRNRISIRILFKPQHSNALLCCGLNSWINRNPI
jgi:hypothetical protein